MNFDAFNDVIDSMHGVHCKTQCKTLTRTVMGHFLLLKREIAQIFQS